MKVVDAWTSYWISGQSDSFIPEGVEKPFAMLWGRFAGSLNAPAEILDLCCGNGAVGLALEQAVTDKSLNITGVDYADIQAQSEGFKTHTLRFISKTDVAALPFNDASFDAAVSQFGIEYSDWQKALSEVARVTKPDAKVCFVLHRKDSLIANNTAAQLEALQAIAESGFFNVYADFLSLLDEAGEGNQLALQIRIDEANKAIAGVSKKLGDKAEAMGGSATIVTLLEAASDIFQTREQTSLEDQLKRLGAYELMNMAAIERMKNMQAVAFDEDQIESFVDVLKRTGFNTEVNVIGLSAGIVGYQVTGTRNG